MKEKYFCCITAFGKCSLVLFLLLTFSSSLLAQQPVRVAGTVRDSKGSAVSGVSINQLPLKAVIPVLLQTAPAIMLLRYLQNNPFFNSAQ
jgi:hypothetical protein